MSSVIEEEDRREEGGKEREEERGRGFGGKIIAGAEIEFETRSKKVRTKL
jgi:hypothetical protein